MMESLHKTLDSVIADVTEHARSVIADKYDHGWQDAKKPLSGLIDLIDRGEEFAAAFTDATRYQAALAFCDEYDLHEDKLHGGSIYVGSADELRVRVREELGEFDEAKELWTMQRRIERKIDNLAAQMDRVEAALKHRQN